MSYIIAGNKFIRVRTHFLMQMFKLNGFNEKVLIPSGHVSFIFHLCSMLNSNLQLLVSL